MISIFSKLSAYKGCIFFIILFASCSSPEEVIPKPIISITTQFPQSQDECISGIVNGADGSLFNIAVYAKIEDGWYNIPERYNPLTTISEDGSWICKTIKDKAGEVSALNIYLLPNGYEPPILLGESIIPIKMNLVAASKKSMVR